MTSKVVELQQQMRNNSEDLQDFLRDLGQWTQQMEVKDQQLRNKKAEKKSNESEPPRSVEELKRKIQLIAAEKEKNTSTTAEKKTKTTVSTKPKEKKITSTDYNAWSKFDVERALVDLDKDGRIQESEFIDMDPAMRLQRAVVEKDRGNDFFKAGKYSEAVRCYTRGIQCDPKNALLPANRAMAYLKMKDWSKAEADCSLALSLDESYVKAYLRRGTARKEMKEYEKAIEDFKHVLLLEPKNKEAQSDIDDIQKIMNKPEKTADKVIEKPAKSVKIEDNIKGMFSKPNDGAKKIPGQIFPIEKPPHLRSSAPLQKVEIIEVDDNSIQASKKIVEENTTTKKKLIEIIETDSSQPEMIEEKIIKSEESASQISPKPSKTQNTVAKAVEEQINATVNQVKSSENKVKSKKWKKPTSVVQFTSIWSKLTTNEDKAAFLGLLETSDYPRVFKHSMEPAIFSAILSTLPDLPNISAHVLGISRVPRVSALIMFLSSNEQSQLQAVLEKVKTAGKLSTSELKEIQTRLSAL